MPTSAKRLGLDVQDNLELEIRLRRIEIELEKKAETSSFSEEGSADTQRVDIIPQVTGLRVSGSTPGAITVAWSQVRISDLRRYELDIAEDLAFATNAETKNLAGTEYTYNTNSDTGGGGDTDIFVRVRARSSTGNVGPYSIVLNATTGQAQSEDIADDAVTSDKIDNSAIIQLALKEYFTPRGFHMSNATIDTIRDAITVTAGVARGEADNGTIDLSSATTKDITATFAKGTGNGGFPTTALTLTDGTDYRVFAIGKIDGTAPDVGYDTSATAANLIAEAVLVDSGYAGALYRQIGWIEYTSAVVGIRSFYSPIRDPEVVFYNDNLVKVTVQTNGQNSKLYTLDVPPDVTAYFRFRWGMDSGSSAVKRVWIKSTPMLDAACDDSNFTHDTRRKGSGNTSNMWHVYLEVDSVSQIRARFDNTAAGNRDFTALGYRFHR